MSLPLQDKTSVVTGASSGIGRAVAEKLGGAGAHVYLVGRTIEAMEQTKSAIENAGGRAEVVSIDVRDADALRGVIARAVEETGRLDVMVNNAGLSHPESILDGDETKWQEMFDVNVVALLVGCQAAVRAMRECGAEGHVVNISSIAALRPDSGVYGATKHAVNTISNQLRGELEDDSIRVVNVMPGAIATNFARNFDPEVIQGMLAMTGIEADVRKGEKLPDELFEKLSEAMQQLLGTPEHVADAVYYAVTQPIHVNVAQIVVRPPKQLQL